MSEKILLDKIQELSMVVSEMNFKLGLLTSSLPPAFMSAADYAETLGLKEATVMDRFKKGKYNTPEGFSESCYDYGGKRGGIRFIRMLADRYYSINIKNAMK